MTPQAAAAARPGSQNLALLVFLGLAEVLRLRLLLVLLRLRPQAAEVVLRLGLLVRLCLGPQAEVVCLLVLLRLGPLVRLDQSCLARTQAVLRAQAHRSPSGGVSCFCSTAPVLPLTAGSRGSKEPHTHTHPIVCRNAFPVEADQLP